MNALLDRRRVSVVGGFRLPGSVGRSPSRASHDVGHRNWTVVAGAFVVLMVGWGAAYSFGAFAGLLAEAFDASHAATSLIFSVCAGTVFLTSAVSGPLADRIGARRMALSGMLLVGAGLAVAGAAPGFLLLLLGYGLCVGCGIGLAYVPALAAVQRSFAAQRGLASGIATSGIGIGTALVPWTTQTLLDLGEGWRGAFLLAGAIAASVGTCGALLLTGRPGAAPQGPAPVLGAGWPRAAPRPDFALLWAGCLLISVPFGLPFAHIVAFATTIEGVALAEAVQLIGLIGLASVGGRFLIGALGDLVGRRIAFLGCCWCLTAATAAWAMAGNAPMLRGFAVVFGIASGGFVALLPAFITDVFGRAQAGSMIGLLYTSRGLALLLAAPLAAVAAEAAADPSVPLAAAAVMGALGAALLRLPGRRARPRR
jgi:MFS family permease